MITQDFLAAFNEAKAIDDDFQQAVRNARNDVMALADLMADAIEHQRKTRGDSVIGRDGKALFTASQLFACYMVDAAQRAYSAARIQHRIDTVRPNEYIKTTLTG
jgi:hypothetical protein